MKRRIPWSVKGIDDDARQSAKAAARDAGMTLGEWLNKMIKDNASNNEDERRHPTTSRPVQTSMQRAMSGGGQSRSGSTGDDEISRRLDSLAGQLSGLSQPRPQRANTAVSRFMEPARRSAGDTVAIQALIDRIEASERTAANTLNQLSARIDHMSDKVASAVPAAPAMPQKPEDVPGFTALETAMRNIVDHIEASELSTRDTLKALQQRMSDMATRAAEAASEQLTHSAPAISSLEQRINELNQRLETTRNETSRDLQQFVEGHVSQLAERIDAVRHSTDAIAGQAQAAAAQAAQSHTQQLEERLTAIVNDLSTKQRPDADIQRIYADIDGLNRRFDELAAQAPMDQEVAALRAAVEQLSSASAQTQDVPAQLEQLSRHVQHLGSLDVTPQLSELEQRIASMDAQLQQAVDNPGDPASASRLSDQISSVNERLSATELKLNHLATIEQSIEQLYRSAEETRNWASQAAEDAAQRMAQQLAGSDVSSAPGTGSSVELQALENGLNAVKASAEQADQRTQETLEAVHDTLAQIIDKLAQLEGQGQAPQPQASMDQAAQMPPVHTAPDMAAAQPQQPAQTAIHSTDPFAGNVQDFLQPEATQPAPLEVSQDQPGQPDQQYTAPASGNLADTPVSDMGVPDPEQVDQTRTQPPYAGADAGQAAEPVANDQSGEVQEDFIAAARRAAQNAASQRSSILGSLGGLSAGSPATAAQQDDMDEKPAGRFRLPFRRKSKDTDEEPIPSILPGSGDVEEAEEAGSAGSRRRYLILAGLVLLAAVSAFALGGGKKLLFSSDITAQPAAVVGKADPQPVAPGQASPAPSSRVAAVEPGAVQSEIDVTPPDLPIEALIENANEAAETAVSAPASDVVTASLEQPAAGRTDLLSETTAKQSLASEAGGLSLTSPAQASVPSAADALPAELGVESLRAAAAGGDANAQFVIASRYLDGKTVERDFRKAAEWYRKAATQGLAPAQYRLGTLYERGHGVTKDLDAARQWYEGAAANQNVKAMHNLAVIYANNDNSDAQFDKAAKWFNAAADHGLKDSVYNLAVLHERGLGVTQDTKQAYYWYGIAARHGDADAKAKLTTLTSFLTKAQKAEMDDKIAAWQPKQPDRNGNFVAITDPSWKVTVAPPQAPDAGAFADLSEKELVLKAQQMLSAMGYDVGPLDGVMGSRTANAVRLYQLQTGTQVNGTVTPELVSRLSARAS